MKTYKTKYNHKIKKNLYPHNLIRELEHNQKLNKHLLKTSTADRNTLYIQNQINLLTRLHKRYFRRSNLFLDV